MSTDRITQADKELWQRLATGPVASPEVSDLEFAAWLEGRLSETQAARIEAAVATNPEMRRAAMDLSEILGMPLPAAPPRMAVRAQALVGFEAERAAPRHGWLRSLLGLGGGFALPRAAMATAAVMIAISGFMLGGGLGESYAKERYGNSGTVVSSQNSNELTAFFASDGI
ncbi:MAG: hypothetical protein JSR24_06820 [Proteobacteria bacterium]|nr:hypothetical protein [Pseudomonadota bacterium]